MAKVTANIAVCRFHRQGLLLASGALAFILTERRSQPPPLLRFSNRLLIVLFLPGFIPNPELLELVKVKCEIIGRTFG